MNRKIAKLIIQAQIASDGGKGIYELDMPNNTIKNYYGKDVYILAAIKEIIKKKNSGFSFYVTNGGSTPYLVYFNFYLYDKKFQVSFHSFDKKLNKYYKKNSKKHAVEWDHGKSRLACQILKSAIVEGGDYERQEFANWKITDANLDILISYYYGYGY